MSLAAPVERQLTAFLPDQEDLDQDNPIHANSVAREQGFKAALIPGPTLFGWTVPAVRDALGDRWLHDGWADIRYRRPVYPGDALIVRVAPPADSSKSDAGNADGACELRVANAAGDLVTVGQVGLGRASWCAELKRPIRIDIQPPREPRLPLTPDNIPRGRDLPARRLHISPQQAADYARIVQGDDDSLWRPSQGTGSAQGPPSRLARAARHRDRPPHLPLRTVDPVTQPDSASRPGQARRDHLRRAHGRWLRAQGAPLRRRRRARSRRRWRRPGQRRPRRRGAYPPALLGHLPARGQVASLRTADRRPVAAPSAPHPAWVESAPDQSALAAMISCSTTQGGWASDFTTTHVDAGMCSPRNSRRIALRCWMSSGFVA